MCYSWHRSFKYSFIFKVIRSLKNVPTWIMIVSSTSLQQWQALDDRGMHKTLHKMTIRLADNTVLHGPTQRLFFSFFTFFSFLDENRSDQNPSFWNWKNGFQKKIRVWMRMALRGLYKFPPGLWKNYYMREREQRFGPFWQFAYLFLGGRSCVLEDLRMRLILTSKRNIRNNKSSWVELNWRPDTLKRVTG